MNEFDHFVKRDLGIQYYGRYVDDFVLVHKDKHHLLWAINEIRVYLTTHLNLVLHPNKIYLQHYTKGVTYLGAIIKPQRTYISPRTKGAFNQKIHCQNQVVNNRIPTKIEIESFVSIMNSYFGLMKHHKTYSLRKKTVEQNLSEDWYKYVILSSKLDVFVSKKESYVG